MDVSCGRCKTEYDFDDALISERGTTVRCTNCGLEFKIFPEPGRNIPELWAVVSAVETGAPPRHYQSLNDLQRAISRGEVQPDDLMSRGDEQARPLESIVELQPLLRQSKTMTPPPVAPVVAHEPFSVPSSSRLPEVAPATQAVPDEAAPVSSTTLDARPLEAAVAVVSPLAPTSSNGAPPLVPPVAKSLETSVEAAIDALGESAASSVGRFGRVASGTALGLPSLADIASKRRPEAAQSTSSRPLGVGKEEASKIPSSPPPSSKIPSSPPPSGKIPSSPSPSGKIPSSPPPGKVPSSPPPDVAALPIEQVAQPARDATVGPAPSLEADGARAPAGDADFEEVREDAIVRSLPPESFALQSASSAPPATPLPPRPRIQSALSFRPAEPEGEEAPSSSQKGPRLAPSPLSSRAQLPSLSSTLSGRHNPSPVPAPPSPRTAPVDSRAPTRAMVMPELSPSESARSALSAHGHGSSLPPPLPANAHFASPHLPDVDAPPSTDSPISSARTTSSKNPLLLTSDELRAVTPLPTPLGSLGDGSRISTLSTAPRQRGARSGIVVGVVLMSAAAFVGLSSRERISGWIAQSKAVTTGQEEPAALAPDLEKQLGAAEVEWWRLRLWPESDPRREEIQGVLDKRLQKLSSSLRGETGAANGWARVDTLRMSGRSEEARRGLVASMGARRPYSLALLDLADSSAEPPWPAIAHQLEEAKVGESGDYLARSALVYSLAMSGSVDQAEAELEQLGRLPDGTRAPLYLDLVKFLERRAALETREGGAAADVEVPPIEVEAPSAVPAEPISAAPPSPDAPAGAAAPTPEALTPTVKLPRAPKPAAVTDEVRELVASADALWASGDLSGAAGIYRQVAAKVGPSHFVGQRASARVAYAEREKNRTQE